VAPLLRRPKIFYTPNAYFGMTGERTLRTRVYTFFERLLSPIGTTINVSQDEATFAFQRLKLPQNKSVLIPNPVDSRWFRPASVTERLDARSDFTVPPKATVIGYASRFSPQKDPYVALNAFAALAAERPDVHLLYLCKRELIGEAVQFAQSHALAHRITFADYREDVRSFYHALDVFLITSRYEAGWPFVVLEAMASGLPIVASRCPGMSDIGNAGLSDARTFEVGSVEGCTSALREAISSRCESENNHRSIVEKRFSVESCFGRLLELYRSS
jgi:glycosyltransferase involved in cell wall biosynthesis